MLATERARLTRDHLMVLERTVAALDNRLQTIQRDIQRSQTGSLIGRVWNLLRSKQGRGFMSAVCNQRIRSNTKRGTHDSPRV